MKKIILNYILRNFFKFFLIVISIIYIFGVILNLFEEIEFFKNLDVNIFLPLILTGIFVPSMILNLLPFIIFLSSMLYMLKIRDNKDFLAMKVFGFSSLKIFFILGLTAFVIGWMILIVINPVTSSMLRFYEKTKATYARDIDHLITFNKNGLWIKENLNNGERVITASKPDGANLIDVKIFQFNNEYELEQKIISKKVNIESFTWIMSDVVIFEKKDSVFSKRNSAEYKINSSYNHERIINLFNNSNTISFLDLMFNQSSLIEIGYNKEFLSRSLHSMLVLPFLLFLMTSIASILTMHTLKKSENFKFILPGLIICVLIFYLKDLFLALGKTGRLSETLSIWSPVLTLSLFTFIGVLQINEK